jgi:hypothetical protein
MLLSSLQAQLRLDVRGGEIGINDDSPLLYLRPTSSSGIAGLYFMTTGTGNPGAGSLTGGMYRNYSDNSLRLLNFSTNDLVVNSGGDIGIGTSAPQSDLHLIGDFATQPAVTFYHYQNGWGSNAKLPWLKKGNHLTYGDYLYLSGSGNQSNVNQLALFLSENSIFFGPGLDSGTIGDAVVTVTRSGRMGINTATPEGILHINGFQEPPFGISPGSNNGLLLGAAGNSNYKWIQSYGSLLAINPRGNAVKIGVGGTSAYATLEVLNNGDFQSPNTFDYQDGGITWTDLQSRRILMLGTTANNDFYIFGATSQGLALEFDGDGVGTGVNQSYVSLIDHDSGEWVNLSDERFKEDIRPLEDYTLQKVLQLRPSTYHFKQQERKDRRYFGFIAQELQKIYPDIVRPIGGGVIGLDEGDIAVIAIKAIQELYQQDEERFEVQQGEIAALQRENQQLEQQLEQLETLVYKLLNEQEGNQPGNSYVLPLEQNPQLDQNHPNPFSQNTIVTYFVPENVRVAFLQVSSVDGKILGKVRINETGTGNVTIKAHTYPAGTYLYSLILDGQVVETKRMVLTR